MKVSDSWITEWSKQLDTGERSEVSAVRRYYQGQYFRGADMFISTGQTSQFTELFKVRDFENLYRSIYVNIGLRFANWYAKNNERLITKSINTKDYSDIWEQTFATESQRVAGSRIVLVQGTAKAELEKNLKKLMRDADFQALGAQEKGRILRSRFNKLSQYQAERIVRTEATNAANLATERAALDIYGAKSLQKQWITAIDGRERPAHNAANGQIVEMEDFFSVGGEQLMRAGDPRGSAGNVINCRCAIAHIPKDDAEVSQPLDGFGFGLAAETIAFEGESVISARKPSKEVVEEAVEYEFKPSNWDEFAAGQVKDDSYLGLLKNKWSLRKATEAEGSAMMPSEGAVRIYLERHKVTRGKILAHEFGHAVDDDLGWTGWRANQTDPRIKKLISKQAKELGYKRGGKLDSKGLDLQSKWGGGDYNVFLERQRNYRRHEEWIATQRGKFPQLSDEEFEESVGAVADWLGSVTTNTIGWGHKKSYMSKPYLRAKEFIAHSFENKYDGNEVFKYYFPQQYQETIDLLDDLIKNSKYDFIGTFNRVRKTIS